MCFAVHVSIKGHSVDLFTFPSQLDADRDEEEVFCDISKTLDNRLLPSKRPAAGENRNYSDSIL